MRTATRAPEVKKTLIDALTDEAGTGMLGDVEVHYAWSGAMGARSIYGGGWRFEHEQAVAEHNVLPRELVSVALYVQVVARPPVDVAETDAAAADIGGLLVTVLTTRALGDGLSWYGLKAGQGDYARTDLETRSIHAFQAQVWAYLPWGS